MDQKYINGVNYRNEALIFFYYYCSVRRSSRIRNTLKLKSTFEENESVSFASQPHIFFHC